MNKTDACAFRGKGCWQRFKSTYEAQRICKLKPCTHPQIELSVIVYSIVSKYYNNYSKYVSFVIKPSY